MHKIFDSEGNVKSDVPIPPTSAAQAPPPAAPVVTTETVAATPVAPGAQDAIEGQAGAAHVPKSGLYDVKPSAIPQSLRAIDNWIHWREEPNANGEPTKVPYQVGSQYKAASTKPSTWSSFKAAAESLDANRGLGFVLPLNQTHFFFDYDHARDPQTGEIQPWARRVIERLNSYTEVSPSDEGLHTYGLTKGPVPSKGAKKGSAELYTQGRYTTVTGRRLDDSPVELVETDVGWLHRLTEAGVLDFTDPKCKYSKLFNNVADEWKQFPEYPSQSEADLGLCALLAQKLGNDIDSIDCAFRLSGLMRPKWDEKRPNSTYGRDTILKALKDKGGASSLSIERLLSDTDTGNAKRLIARHKQDLRYSYILDNWLVWDGQRFAVDHSGAIYQRAEDTAHSIIDEAASTQDEHRRVALLNWAKQSHNRGRISGMIALAQSQQGIPVTNDELDADPYLLNCRNGTLELKTGKLREHHREDLITKLIPVDYDPDAKCDLWEKFLYRIMDGNTEMISFLQRAVGYSLCGSIKERVMFIAHGSGSNGKTVFLEVLNALLGDYTKTTDSTFLMVKKSGGPRNDIAKLEGIRVVLTSETSEGANMDEGIVKWLTGGDKISARRLYCEDEEFYFLGKIWLRTNKKPQIHGVDLGIWSRIRLIPFAVEIPKPEQDGDLRDKLLLERSGILAWAVRGFLEYQEKGLGVPSEVTEATQQYQIDSDALAPFFEDCCLAEKGNENLITPHTQIYYRFHKYSLQNGPNEKYIMSSAQFGKALEERGFKRKKHNGVRCRVGIMLKPDAPTGGGGHTPWTGGGQHVDSMDSTKKSAVHEGTIPKSEDYASKL